MELVRVNILRELIAYDWLSLPEISQSLDLLPFSKIKTLTITLRFFRLLSRKSRRERVFDFGDCAIGNIIFSGCF